MNMLLFLLVCIVVYSMPFPYQDGMLSFGRLIRWLPLRLLWAVLVWALTTVATMTTLPWAVVGLAYGWMVLLLISGMPRKRPPSLRHFKTPVMCVAMVMIVTLPTFTSIAVWTSGLSNAESVDTFITVTDEPLFNSPIPDNMVRLVTGEYAAFVARQYFAGIGSNVEVAATHITTRNGRLVWVCVVVSTNVLAENYIQSLVVVDANDPAMIEVIEDIPTTMPGEGLFWDQNIHFRNYLNDMTELYEYAYPTWDPAGNLVYIQTRTSIGWDLVERPLGPVIYCSNGTVRRYATIEETPTWVSQVYSEEWLERQVNRWGAYRRGDGFDLFAGGFLWVVQPSRDRLEMTEDTRYIINPDNGRVEALVAVNPPESTSLTLSGIMRATRDGIFFHTFPNGTLISGEAATNEVIKGLPNPTSGSYFGAMPLLYPVEIAPGVMRYAWYCPIYWYDGYYDSDAEEYYITDIRLHAFAIADAQDPTIKYLLTRGGTVTGEVLVRQVREGYVQTVRDALHPSTGTVELSATVLNISSYVYEGDTHIVLRTDNSTYEWIEGTREWMPLDDWYELLSVRVGDGFHAVLQQMDDEYRIVAFEVL